MLDHGGLQFAFHWRVKRPTTLWYLALAAALAASCDTSHQSDPPTPVGAGALDEAVIEVETAPLRRGTITQHISAPGSVVARRESHIGAEVSGRIVRIHVFEGDRVEAGAPLFEIDRAPFAIALRQATAGLDVARAERQQIAADLRRAEALQRENLLSPQEVERLTTSLAVAQAHERAAAEAVELAQHNLERTMVPAPFAGSVAERLADEGTTALVQPQTIVVVLQETAELEAHAAIPESQMALVRVGDTALVRIEGLVEPVATQITAVSDTIDRTTRTYLVKMRVPNAGHRIKAGIFAQVEITPQGSTDVVLAPREAVRVEDGRTRLLLVRDGRVDALPIEVGTFTETDVEILAGASAGDTAIVGTAARTIAPGMPVRAREAPPDRAS
jgi:membrane fusion protein (multidrug efflux system)